MWQAVVIRKSEGVVRAFEKPLIDHLVEELNEIERKHGKITMAHLIELKEEAYAEMVVQTEDK